MKKVFPQVLLVHTVSKAVSKYGLLQKTCGKTAPLGVACLAASFPEQVFWVDLQGSLPSSDCLETFNWQGLKACIVQGASDWDKNFSSVFGRDLSAALPGIPRILAGEALGNCSEDWDGYLNGTGYVLIENILKGRQITNPRIDTLAQDLTRSLSIPESSLGDFIGYETAVEKSSKGKTISVYQPWLGLLDRSSKVTVVPPKYFLAGLGAWMKKSGFSGLVFESSNLDENSYLTIQSVMRNFGTVFSITLESAKVLESILPLGRESLFKLWIRPKDFREFSWEFQRIARILKKEEVNWGLRLQKETIEHPVILEMISLCEEISIDKPNEWPFEKVRKIILEFYLRDHHIAKKLFKVNSFFELTRLMRGAYVVLDLLLK